ncbi:MAG: hypothetical protein BWY27_00291 [Bacteroidetes bacterium ADurb.Bin234]|nr:MAG: hypothetical protein BWY27_00291 [Bacteroidetes bacterium ADurb.Bin234]
MIYKKHRYGLLKNCNSSKHYNWVSFLISGFHKKASRITLYKKRITYKNPFNNLIKFKNFISFA